MIHSHTHTKTTKTMRDKNIFSGTGARAPIARPHPPTLAIAPLSNKNLIVFCFDFFFLIFMYKQIIRRLDINKPLFENTASKLFNSVVLNSVK